MMMSKPASPTSAGKTIAVLGTSVTLPQNINDRRALFEACKAKRQLSTDMVKAGRYEETDIDVNRDHPWKLKNRYANCFNAEMEEDINFFSINGKSDDNIRFSCAP
jgi:hypothetical protein